VAVLRSFLAVHPPVRLPFDQYAKLLDDEVIYQRDLMFAVRDEGRIVGYTRLQRAPANEGLVFTGVTGVVRSHRRRGITTAIKAHAIQLIKDQGFHTIQTDNDETNPMYQINLRLGFKPFMKWIKFEKRISGS
jgi:GNAT superfamily N-acetyltransferase